MNNEPASSNHQESEYRLTRRAHAVAALSGLVLSLYAGSAMADHLGEPDMNGETTVRIAPGDTLTDIVVDNVDGGADEVKSVINYVVETNPDVFEDGTAKLGSEDLGEEITVPESVGDK